MITISDHITNPILSNWEKFDDIMDKNNDILYVAHTTVRIRLGFANVHLSILRQAQNNSMKRAMFEDTVINLVSSLEAIAHLSNGHNT
jgi:hypothetical protein